MTTASLMTVEVMSNSIHDGQEFDYRLISDPSDREWAESAAGFITFGLGQAVVKVLEAGNLLAEAKRRLPHGEYTAWVNGALPFNIHHAAKLVKAAEWATKLGHVPSLKSVTDTRVLFLLSADTTTDEVREWFMERCASGDPPTRMEVQDRKRSAGQPRQPQPAETLALSLIRKGELDRLREAIALAERATVVTAEQVMEEQHLRDLGKQRHIAGAEADFHKMKDGSWIRMPHAGRVDLESAVEEAPMVEAVAAPTETLSPMEIPLSPMGLMSIEDAAEALGMRLHTLRQRLTPGAISKGGQLQRNGLLVTKEGRGQVRLTPI